MNNSQSNQPGVNIFVGIVLVIIGGLWLAANFIPGFEIDWNFVWPLFILLPGLFLYSIFVRDRNNWPILIPATILTLLGVNFYVNTLFAELLRYPQIWGWTVFMYPLSISIAFFVAWRVSKKMGLIVPAVILALVSVFVACVSMTVFTFADGNFRRVISASWPILLIIFGLVMMFGGPLWGKMGITDKVTKPEPVKPIAEEAEIVQKPE